MHRRNTGGQGEQVVNQAFDINCTILKQFKRRRETTATRTDNSDFIDDEWRGIDFSLAVKS